MSGGFVPTDTNTFIRVLMLGHAPSVHLLSWHCVKVTAKHSSGALIESDGDRSDVGCETWGNRTDSTNARANAPLFYAHPTPDPGSMRCLAKPDVIAN